MKYLLENLSTRDNEAQVKSMILLAMATSVIAVTGCTSGPASDAARTSSEPQPTQSASTKVEKRDQTAEDAPKNTIRADKDEKPQPKSEGTPENKVQAGKDEARFGEVLVFPNKVAVTVEFVKYFKILDEGFAVGAEPGDDAGLFKVTLHNGSNVDFDGSVAGISAIDYGNGSSAEIVFDEAAGAEAVSFGNIKPGETAEILDGRILPQTQEEITVKVFGDSPGTDEPFAEGTVVDSP